MIGGRSKTEKAAGSKGWRLARPHLGAMYAALGKDEFHGTCHSLTFYVMKILIFGKMDFLFMYEKEFSS